MPVIVTREGINYPIPLEDEEGWGSLTDYLVALASAASTQSMSFNVRIATTTPQTLQATDTILCMNVASASAVTLPIGVTKQFYGIYDTSGNAATNNITITPTGGQLINGAANYVISANRGGILTQFNGSEWVLIARIMNNILIPPLKVPNNATNNSFIEAGITNTIAFPSVNNLQSCSASFIGSNSILLVVNLSTGESIFCTTSFLSDRITALNDSANIYLSADAGTGFMVTKAASSSTVTFKNRMGGARNVEIKTLSTNLSSVTAWS